ncbi:MAG: UpxY family transcription antiterminator [Bernardetiaceae bacterium]|nr:UpxY family transcription antiterminator [Bernardetiaceae bacterium]
MKQNTETNNWLVVRTRPNAEKKVSQRLTEAQVENYLPLQRQLRQWSDRKKWVDMVVFTSYVFVRLPYKDRHLMYNMSGIIDFVRIGKQLARVSDKEIERIKRFCSGEKIVSVQQSDFERGTKVEILEGHFAGIIGEVIEGKKNDKLRIHVFSLNSVMSVVIDKGIAKKIIDKHEQ